MRVIQEDGTLILLIAAARNIDVFVSEFFSDPKLEILEA